MRGVVVCPQPLAAEAGAAVLAEGGNAFDAAIAGAFVQMVTDPQMCGLGGYGCAVYRHPGETGFVEFHARFGSRGTPAMWADDCLGVSDLGAYSQFADHRSSVGHRSICTPGTVAGLAELTRHARLPWTALVAPAVDLCRRGFVATESMFAMLARTSGPGFPSALERVAHTPASADLWCRPDGSLKQPGDHWHNPDLAATLERLARVGPADFYQGELGDLIAAEIARGGGTVTRDDLRAYRVRVGPTARGWFRGYRVEAGPPPAGGVTLLQILHVLDRLPLARPGSPEAAVRLAGAMREAYAVRARTLGDPEVAPSPLDELLGGDWAAAAAARVAAGTPVAAAVGDGGGGTTHLSAADAEGNAVALTHSLGVYSGVIAPGTGIALNSAMDQADPRPGRPGSIVPGAVRRTAHCPALVFAGDRLVAVTGTPGANAQPTCVAQVLVGLYDGGCSPHEAVAAPRLHCEGGPVFVEGRVPARVRSALTAAGFDVRGFTGNYVGTTGRNQLIAIGPNGALTGASDPRRDGGVAAYSDR